MERASKISLALIDVQMDSLGVFPKSIFVAQGRSGDKALQLDIKGITDSKTKVDPKGKKPTEHTFYLNTQAGEIILKHTRKDDVDSWKAELITSKK